MQADPTASLGRVLDEHAELRDVLAQLGETGEVPVVGGLLRRLHALLGPHFEREEEPGGLLHVIGAEGGSRADTARRLMAEHRELLATVSALAAGLSAPGPRPLAEIERDVATLVARLRAHDERETDLLGAGAGSGGRAALDRAGTSVARSRALTVNLRRTAVDVVIPAEQAVLLEITAHLHGVQQVTRALLREINHPYVGWTQTLGDLHRRGMSDFAHHAAHARAGEAIAVVCGLYGTAVDAVPPPLRDTAVRYHLLYLEHVARESGSEVLPAVLPAVAQALARLRRALCRAPTAAASASTRSRSLARTLLAEVPDDDHGACDVVLRLLADTLDHTYARWLAAEDPASWWRALVGIPATTSLPAPVAAIAHERLGECRRVLPAAVAQLADRRASASALLALPDQETIERGYIDAAAELDPVAGAPSGDALTCVRWHMRILAAPMLAGVHPRALTEVTRRYVDVMRTADRPVLEQLVRETFTVLGQEAFAASGVAFDLIERIGREGLATGDADTAELVIDELLALDFPYPEFAGFTDEWGVRVNRAHLSAIRTFLALVEASPWGARQLVAALVVHLRIGGVFLADTDLFQRDVSRLLAHDLRAVRHESRHLLRLLPVYFQELGAEGALRDVSTRLDEIGGREDPLCNFLRKQCHVESNPRLVDFVEAVGCFWATGDAAVLGAYVPGSLFERLHCGPARTPGIARAFSALVGDGDPRTPFTLDPPVLARRLEAVSHVRPVERQKVALLCELRRLIGRKYELGHDDLLQRLRAFHRIPAAMVDALERTLAHEDPGPALDALLDVLERLEAIVADRAPTEPIEDIYHKRHIAAGIPSMYGRYREPRFDATGLGLRAESLAGVLLERLAVRCDVETVDADTLREVARAIALTIRALRVDGCGVAGLGMHAAMLDEALAQGGVGRAQYIDVFRALAHDVQQLLRLHVFDVYEPVLEPVLGRMIDRGLLAVDEGDDREETVLKAAERFLRDIIARSFALPQLDRIVGQTLRTLAQQRDLAPSTVPPRRRIRFLDEAWCVPLHDPHPPAGALRLGSKGYLVRSMAHAGFPVPPGFILSTELFHVRDALSEDAALARQVWARVDEEVARLEQLSGRRFGDPGRPLLLSVRSGSAISMPGMLDTFLNVGISADVAAGFAAESGHAWAAWDAYRRFLQLWGMSHGIHRDRFDALIREAKQRFRATKKSDLGADDMRALTLSYRQLVLDQGVGVCDDPRLQLRRCVELVQASWHAERARIYRGWTQISEAWGTAVMVQAMVYGNLGERSGTGVALTCDPRRGGTVPVELHGDFAVQGQGDDVVGGLVETFPVGARQPRAAPGEGGISLERDFPAVHAALLGWARALVVEQGMSHQEIEFTFEGDRAEDLYILQTRDVVSPESRGQPAFVPGEALVQARVATGIGAGGGALSGRVAISAAEVDMLRARSPDEPIILLRADTVPDDVPLLLLADGMVTALGGATSHAAVAARRLSRTCVVGCRTLEVDETTGRAWLGGERLAPGDWLSIDGFDGTIYQGRHATAPLRRQRAG